jgi:hypothetical protein
MADLDEKGKKEKWYPGKLVAKAVNARRSTLNSRFSGSHGDDSPVRTHSQSGSDMMNEYYVDDSPNGSFTEANPLRDQNNASEVDHTESHSQVPKLEDKTDIRASIAAPAPTRQTLKMKKLGKITLNIREIRYLAITSAKAFVDIDGLGIPLCTTGDITYPLTKEIDFYDIAADLKIEFRGIHMTTQQPVLGYVILPICQALSPVGKPSKTATKWYEVYPYYDRVKLGESRKITKFRTAYPDIPGSALSKPTFSLGFLQLDIELTLDEDIKNGLSLYFYPNLRYPNHNTTRPDDEADVQESTLILTNARILRDMERIRNIVFRPFSCIAPFLSFPEVFPLIVVNLLLVF